jgi:hypothetical protein
MGYGLGARSWEEGAGSWELVRLPAICLLGLGLLSVPWAMLAQAPDSGSTAPAASDSQPASHSDSVLAADSTRAGSDTVRPKTPGSSPTPATTGARPEPVDSILNAACGAPGSTAVARDLLVIVFAPEARAADRATVAKTVDGRLLGSVTSGGPGTYYLRVPSGGNEYRLRAAADRLILLDMVRQVGSRNCPPPPPADTAGKNSP